VGRLIHENKNPTSNETWEAAWHLSNVWKLSRRSATQWNLIIIRFTSCVCLLPVYCEPNVANVSGLSILVAPLVFLSRLFIVLFNQLLTSLWKGGALSTTMYSIFMVPFHHTRGYHLISKTNVLSIGHAYSYYFVIFNFHSNIYTLARHKCCARI
jgi:hypothetical protein